MKKILLSFIILIMTLTTYAVEPMLEGEEIQMGRESHGGDNIGIEFLTSARAGIKKLSEMPITNLPVSLLLIEKTLNNLKVIVTDEELVINRDNNTQISSAINYYDDTGKMFVKINRSRWNQMADIDKAALAIHEVLCLLKVEETYKYPHSSRISSSILTLQLLMNGYDCDGRFRGITKDHLGKLLSNFEGMGGDFKLRFFVDYRDNSIKYIFEMQNKMIGNFTTSRSTQLCKKKDSPDLYIPVGGMVFKLTVEDSDFKLHLLMHESHPDYIFNRLED